MKTAGRADPSNVVNASFTMVSQSLPWTVGCRTHAI
jgi:hypothetical protein